MKDKRPATLVTAKDRAVALHAEFKNLVSSLDKNAQRTLEKSCKRFHEISLGDISDALCTLQSELIAKTDGRPQPLDLSVNFCVPDKHREEYPETALAQIDSQCDEYAVFGECYEPGYPEKASLGHLQLEMDDLVKVRDWVDQVIKWHQANPKSRKK